MTLHPSKVRHPPKSRRPTAITARSFAKSNVALDALDAEIDNNYPEFPEELRGQFGEGAQRPGDAPSTLQRRD
jgi:hypothetical protein